MTNKIQINVYMSDGQCVARPPELLKDFINFFQKKLDSVPDEFKDIVTIDVESGGMYESVDYHIWYAREKTIQDQIKESLDKQKNDELALKKIKDDELAQLKYLKNKYEV